MPPPSSSAAGAAEEALAELGLTPLEAGVYRFLLSEPGSTGYRIAQAMGKPVGNIYKTVEALEGKGAVVTSDDGGNRTAAAIPMQEWLRARRKAFERACTVASKAVASSADKESFDDSLYRLTHRDQVLERCRSMLQSAQQFVIVTAAPALVPELSPALQASAKRIPVALKVFVPAAIPGVVVVVDPRGAPALETSPGAWLVVNADGRECLVALFDTHARELHTASWTRNPLVVWTHYTGHSSDLLLAAVRTQLGQGATPKQIASALKKLSPFENPASAGKVNMRQRYRSASPQVSRRPS